jgi:hypothetical protein
MSPLQFASYITACAPWAPTLLGLRSALARLRAEGAWPRLAPPPPDGDDGDGSGIGQAGPGPA